MMRAILISIFFAVLLISCQSKKQEEVIIGKFPPKEAEDLKPAMYCYLFTNGRDSIRMTYIEKNNKVEGWLNYDFFEKDGSIGEIDGKWVGDTLKLEYEFLSEGMISEQQVYFLKKNNFKLYRGAGDMKMTDDSVMIYSNPKEISFSDNTPLGELKNCSENFIKQEHIDFYKKESERKD